MRGEVNKKIPLGLELVENVPALIVRKRAADSLAKRYGLYVDCQQQVEGSISNQRRGSASRLGRQGYMFTKSVFCRKVQNLDISNIAEFDRERRLAIPK